MWPPFPLFPVPKRLDADAEHLREVPLGRVKLVPNLDDLPRRKLDLRRTWCRSVHRPERALDACEWVEQRIGVQRSSRSARWTYEPLGFLIRTVSSPSSGYWPFGSGFCEQFVEMAAHDCGESNRHARQDTLCSRFSRRENVNCGCRRARLQSSISALSGNPASFAIAVTVLTLVSAMSHG